MAYTTAIVGSTGFVGNHILDTLLSLPSITSVESISRRSPPQAALSTSTKLTAFTNFDTTTWSKHLSSVSPAPTIFFSTLATTRANAGGVENQRRLEYGVNLELAKAAKEMGVKTYVCVSSAGADPNSLFAYPKMKGEIERDVSALDFEHCIILRPGVLAGNRQETRYAEGLLRGIAAVAGKVHAGLKDGWAQDADIVARAAVSAALQAAEGKAPEKIWVIGQSDIVRLGRTEWKAEP